MKKFALISAILFFVVYFWANTLMPDEDTIPGVYPVAVANPLIDDNTDDEVVLTRIMEAEAPAEEEAVMHHMMEAQAPLSTEDGYYLIVASFTSMDQAEQMAEKYKNDFEGDFIILPPTSEGYYRVSCGKYSTPETADAALPAVKEKVNPDAWLYSTKKPL